MIAGRERRHERDSRAAAGAPADVTLVIQRAGQRPWSCSGEDMMVLEADWAAGCRPCWATSMRPRLGAAGAAVEEVSGVREIPIELIHRNEHQPRWVFSEAEVEELAASIPEGRAATDPGAARAGPARRMGDRRWRAALAGEPEGGSAGHVGAGA